MTKSLTALMAEIADLEARLPVADLIHLSDLTGEQLGVFAEQWKEIAPHRRREVMRRLADICRTNFQIDFSAVALIGIRDPDSQVRLSAIETFWDAEDPGFIAPLLELALTDPEPTVQAEAMQVLGQFVLLGELGQIPRREFDRLTDKLLELLDEQEIATLLRCRTLEAVASAGLERVPELIAQAYKSGVEELKISAVSAMGRTVDGMWEPIILAELNSLSPSMRYHAAQSAGEVGLPAAVAQLIDLLEDPDSQVMGAAIEALGEIGGEEAREALEQLLDDEEFGEFVEDALELIDLASVTPSILTRHRES
jgi:HEAT repeat protein